MNFETGSVRNNFPSSYSIITATLVIGLVIEAMRNIVLVRIGVLLSLSWKPVAWMSTIRPSRMISVTMPAASLRSTKPFIPSCSRCSR